MTQLQRSKTQAPHQARAPQVNHAGLKLFAGALVALVAWGVIVSLPDIKRYIRMSMI